MSTMRERKLRRCSSALGRIQTNNAHSLLSDLGPGREQPEWILREQLDPVTTRRRSVALGERLHALHSLHDLHSFKIDDKVSVEKLHDLRAAFEEVETRGSRAVDVHKFGRILKKCFGLTDASSTQINALFKKIDYSGRGKISWSDLCGHTLQEYREREETRRRWKQVSVTVPAHTRALSHGGPVVNIQCTRDGTICTVREDGSVCYWSSELRPLKTKYMFSEGPSNKWSKWSSAFTLMTEHNKLLMGTGDREIQFYELSSLEPYCQIDGLDTVPLTLHCGYTAPDRCCMVFGDSEGCVNIILISSVEDTLRLWNKLPLTDNIPTISMDEAFLSPRVRFVRWKVHHDWVTQAKYFPSFQSVVSSSNEDTSSLVIGCVLPLTDAEQRLTHIWEECYEGKVKKNYLNRTPQLRASCDQKVFSVHRGVTTFDLCEKHSLMVTGGMDHLIRLWNPCFCGKPTGILKGHPAPIVHMCISSEDNHVFSVSSDSTVKIWDVLDQCCLFTVQSKATGIVGDISACLYSPALQSLYIAADCLGVLRLNTRRQVRSRRPVSHSESVMCCGYSQEFRQVISCTHTLVKVWDLDSGRQVFEFGGSPDMSAITCMTLDPKGRRLFTGSKDGCLRIWNFNNGQCLKTMKKGGEDSEVCCCMYLNVHQNLYVMSAGRSRRIHMYADLPQDPHHMQRPRPPWHDDQGNGHKADILSLAEGPHPLVATGSTDGHILVWNVVSGRIQCRFVSPVPKENQNMEGVDTSVPSVVFLKQSTEQWASPLLSSGAIGYINVWSVIRGGNLVGSFKASKFQQKITKLCKNEKTTLLYAADQIGYIYVYSTHKFTTGMELKQPRADFFWRAHTSHITGLHIVDNDRVVLTSSSDHTVRLWGSSGQFIGTFGQAEPWSVPLARSWMHPSVPYEVLVDPLSFLDHDIVNENIPFSDLVTTQVIEGDREYIKSKMLPKMKLPPAATTNDIEGK